jgi:hypothetical protein
METSLIYDCCTFISFSENLQSGSHMELTKEEKEGAEV